MKFSHITKAFGYIAWALAIYSITIGDKLESIYYTLMAFYFEWSASQEEK